MQSKTLEERFWEKVHKGEGCWEWQGYRAKTGYGMLQARKISPTPLYCHRLAYEFEYGKITDNLHVLHSCDNPACCRPDHLFLGTQRDNNADRTKKKRTASGDSNGARTVRENNPFVINGGAGLVGEKHPMSKLTNVHRGEIVVKHAEGGVTMTSLSKEYGVTVTQISRILKQAKQ